METGRRERYRETLKILGHAAGLSSLAVAALAYGACLECKQYDDCASVDELLKARAAGVTSASSSTNAAELAMNAAIASEWDGKACPTPKQYAAIVSLSHPHRYEHDLDALTVSSVKVSGKCCYYFESQDCE